MVPVKKGVRCQVSGFRLNVGASEKAPLFVETPWYNVSASEISLIVADTWNQVGPETWNLKPKTLVLGIFMILTKQLSV